MIVFDFDGVLFDTARECLAIAYEAARRHPLSPRFAAWGDTPVPPAEVAERFLAHRHWVGPPWQYAVLLECIAAGELPASTDAFLAIARARQPALGGFTDLYFATRTVLAEDVARWTAVITPFAPATTAFARAHAAGEAAVLSTRDDASIRRLLAHFLGITLAPHELLPRSGAREKWEILLDAAAARGRAPHQVFFIDDYLHHARPAHARGISAHLALWGYLAADDAREAAAAGIPCLRLTDLERAIAQHQEQSRS